MFKSSGIRVVLQGCLLITGLVLASCTTTHAEKPARSDDEWVTLPPETGSHLPRRVRRSELEKGTTGSRTVVQGAAAAGEMARETTDLMNSGLPNN